MTSSADGSRLALASDDGTLQLWDGEIGAYVAALEGHSNPDISTIFLEWDLRTS